MTRINTNVPSLVAAMYMNRNMRLLNMALERMASGLRINTAMDDPAGIIVTDVLRGELTGIQDAIGNTQRADNLMATAEGAVAGISDLLLELQQIVFEAANTGTLTGEEIDAKQSQIDNLVGAINQVVLSATFGGQNLLDGSLGYNTANVDPSAILGLAIYKAPMGSTAGELLINIQLQTAAKQGVMVFPNATVTGDVTVRLSGPESSQIYHWGAGTTSSQMVTAVNADSVRTGLVAELVDPGDPTQGMRITTIAYGSKARVSVAVTQGDLADLPFEDEYGVTAIMATGIDAEADINGSHIIGDGKVLHYVTASMNFELEITDAWNTGGVPATTDFLITSGGALFQVGPRIGAAQQVSFGIPAMDSTNLGWPSVGYLDEITSGGAKSLSSGNLEGFKNIIDRVSKQVAEVRVRIGSFQNNTLRMANNSLQQALENISAARSQILDTDYAVETSNMIRQQVLVDATRAAMAMAQQIPQNVLSLLFN